MEMNASKAAGHKIFHGKPSFVDKKLYPNAVTVEILGIYEDYISKTMFTLMLQNKIEQIRRLRI